MKGRQGLVIAWESNYSLSVWVLEGSLQNQAAASRPFWIDIMSTAQKVFLERHSGQPVEQVQCCIDQFEWLDNGARQTFLPTLNSIFNVISWSRTYSCFKQMFVDETNIGLTLLIYSEDEMESLHFTLNRAIDVLIESTRLTLVEMDCAMLGKRSDKSELLHVFPQAMSLFDHLSNSKTLITHTRHHFCSGVSNSVFPLSVTVQSSVTVSCPLCF